MDEKKILIMNLSKGLVGETNANLLGSMLTTRIYLAAMSRADLPVAEMKKMPNFYFYVDEFQSFANATFANILSEARKYHLNLIIAHQYIEQMEEEVRDAVFGNVGTTVAFRVGPFDAETLETVFTPRFLAADLVNLGFAQIYLTLMIDGIGSPPFSAVTLPPIAPPSVSCRDMVIAASRKNYTKPRAVVEAIVTELHTPTPVVKPEKKAAPKPVPRTTPEPVPEKKTMTETKSSTVSNPVVTASQSVQAPAKSVRENVNPAVSKTASLTPHQSVTKPTPPSPAPERVKEKNREPRPERTEHTPRSERRPGKSHMSVAATAPKAKPVASAEDLKSVLAKIAAVPAPGDQKKTDQPKLTPKQAGAPSPAAVSPLKDALRALEATAATPTRDLPPRPVSVREVVTPAMSPAQAAELAALTAEAEAVLAQIPQVVPPSVPPREPISFTPKPVTDASISARPPLVTPQPQPSPTVVTPPPVSDDPLDVKRVAKLLRQSKNEKSPFRP